ncbi:Fic family protein [Achromobacter kerstersii]|uniref:Fic family protein n=1 Tax=Achromobacter kerstersii TaxID=1353890 RepID=UPI0020C65DAD|nr:Fic family protein [Achromobacter kerstersii]
MLDSQFFIAIHDEILAETGGLPGLAGGGVGAVEAALFRIEMHAHYAGLDDVFGIAGLYAEAVARGHVFNDANKRTALTCALTLPVSARHSNTTGRRARRGRRLARGG